MAGFTVATYLSQIVNNGINTTDGTNDTIYNFHIHIHSHTRTHTTTTITHQHKHNTHK